MINSGRGRPKKIPTEEKAMVQLGLLVDAEIAAAIDSKIPKEYKNRSDFMRQAFDNQLRISRSDTDSTLTAFQELVRFAEEWTAIIDDCQNKNSCLNCPVGTECNTADVELSKIVDFVKKVKSLESKDDLSRLLKGFEMLQEEK